MQSIEHRGGGCAALYSMQYGHSVECETCASARLACVHYANYAGAHHDSRNKAKNTCIVLVAALHCMQMQ